MTTPHKTTNSTPIRTFWSGHIRLNPLQSVLIITVHKLCTYLKKGTILEASTSAVLKPWEYSITWAMSCRSGFVMARLVKRNTNGWNDFSGDMYELHVFVQAITTITLCELCCVALRVTEVRIYVHVHVGGRGGVTDYYCKFCTTQRAEAPSKELFEVVW